MPVGDGGLIVFKAANSTVFVLGAGASWHYGYPTGETLVKKVIEKARIAEQFFGHSLSNIHSLRPDCLTEGQGHDADWPTQWEKARDECVILRKGLEQVKPLVIDYYLGWNPDLQNIGRLLIAWVILDCEHHSQNKNINRPHGSEAFDDWCRFIIHQLAIHCKNSKDLLLNKVSFVTFNYDVSLEHALREGLEHIQMFDGKDVATFLGGNRIIHIYGKIRDVPTKAAPVNWHMSNEDPYKLRHPQLNHYQVEMKKLLDIVYAASKGLRVIDPHDKGFDDTEIMIARTAIAHAKRIFILGYGFDEHNSGRLNLREVLAHDLMTTNRVAFTNYGDINQINKRASKLVYGHSGGLQPGGPAVVATIKD
jgi:hypothetical protein